jgi:predicted nuclease with TOPRIM domain
MKGSTSIKGIHSIKSMQSIKKDATDNSDSPDFLKLYMLEKERTRLHNEYKRLQSRLEPIDARLKQIEEYYIASLGTRISTDSNKNQDTGQDDEKSNWQTVEIKY